MRPSTNHFAHHIVSRIIIELSEGSGCEIGSDWRQTSQTLLLNSLLKSHIIFLLEETSPRNATTPRLGSPLFRHKPVLTKGKNFKETLPRLIIRLCTYNDFGSADGDESHDWTDVTETTPLGCTNDGPSAVALLFFFFFGIFFGFSIFFLVFFKFSALFLSSHHFCLLSSACSTRPSHTWTCGLLAHF